MIANQTDEFVGLSGPFRNRPSGKFNGADAIMAKCKPYWVVRYIGGYPYSVLREIEFSSESAAKDFIATFKPATKKTTAGAS